MSFLRHLPPTATPLDLQTLLASVTAKPDAVEEFKERLRHYLGIAHCSLAASGRAALYLSLQALTADADSERKEVIVPAYTCPSVAKVVLDAGLQLRLVDVQQETFAYDLDELASTISERTLAVIVVHPFGIPLPLAPIQQLARQQGVAVIEDAAQSMGAKLDGRSIGTIGDIGLLSLGPGKPMSTGGGGIAVTNDKQIGARLEQAANKLVPAGNAQSWMAVARTGLFNAAFHPASWWLAYRAGANRMGESEASWGYKMRAYTPSQAALGLSLLPKLDSINHDRRVRAMRMLDELPVNTQLQVDPHTLPIYLRYPILLTTSLQREQAVDELNRAGIGAGRMYRKPLTGYFSQLHGHYPGAERVAETLLTLPTHYRVRDDDIARIGRICRRIVSL